MKQLETDILPNLPLFICEKCEYKTNTKKDYNKHILTRKHLNETTQTKKAPKCICSCGDQFNSRTTMWRHKKSCNRIVVQTQSSNIIIELVKQNQEFKQLIIEQNQKILDLSSKPTTTVNNNICSNNKTKFNLNFFLNEQCKDALNITDFVNSLKLQLSDLENTGKYGFVEGISKIFIKGLKELDIYKRPIHCSDIKREIMYVKEENKWEKEKECEGKLSNAIKSIACKNINQIPTWIDEHPNCSDYYSKENDQYLKIINESMGGNNDDQNKEYYDKIVKNVSREVIINDL